MNYLSAKQYAEKWGLTPRRVQVLCNQGRINGAQRVGNSWMIPETSDKPDDARKKTVDTKKKVNADILIERVWAMPNKNTFDVKPIHDLIAEEITDGTWIDPFANKNKFANITNDLNPAYDTDYHLDALDFLKLFDSNSVDGVLYDPPYSPRQVSECYNDVGYNVTWDTTKASFWGNHKREISRIVKLGGKVITFGWNSGGIGYKYGFEIQRILLVPHGGWHNDTICTVEVKTLEPEISFDFEKPEVADLNNKNSLTETDNQLIGILESLPSNYWDFKEDDTREFTHGIHSYPAMMVCPISRNIIKIMKQVREINSLFDPFSGSGTVLVEGMLANIKTIYGNDINPLALFLSKVKTTRIDISSLQNICLSLVSGISDDYSSNRDYFDGIDAYMTDALQLDLTAKDGWGSNAHGFIEQYNAERNFDFRTPDFKNIGYWFKPRVILLLQLIKNHILNIENKDIRDFAFIAFSESIRLVSNRRNGEFKMFRMQPGKVATFRPDVIKEFSTILNRNIEKMNSFIEVCQERGCSSSVTIINNDATSLVDVPDDAADLIITSPPYGDSRTTVAYGEYSRLSLQWLDLFDLSEKQIMGIDRSLMGGSKFRNGFEFLVHSDILKSSLERIKDVDLERAGDVYSFYQDLEAAIGAVAKKTRKGGYHFWVVGNRTVKNELLLTDQIIAQMAQHFDLEYVYTIDRNIINKVMPSLNSPTNESGVKSETMTNEHIVVLRKR